MIDSGPYKVYIQQKKIDLNESIYCYKLKINRFALNKFRKKLLTYNKNIIFTIFIKHFCHRSNAMYINTKQTNQTKTFIVV